MVRGLGKQLVFAQDAPGFIVNRVLMPMINEACFALGEGVATMRDIDTACQLGLNHPMGPLTLADFIGLDTCLEITNVLFASTGDPKFRPAPILAEICRSRLVWPESEARLLRLFGRRARADQIGPAR